MPENQTVWDKQGVKEDTFIQTGRKWGDRQPGQRRLPARWQLAEQAIPHLYADKLGGTTGE